MKCRLSSLVLIASSLACAESSGEPASPGASDVVQSDAASGDTDEEVGDPADVESNPDEGVEGADDTPGADLDAGPDPIDVEADPQCEPLNPRDCLFPYPSSRFLKADPSLPSGFRLDFTAAAIPQNVHGEPFDLAPYQRLDGFSPSTQILTMYDEPVLVTNLAGHDSIERSLLPDHATVLLDMTTGQRVAHWVENDARAESPERTVFYIRPASRLEPAHRYAVAVRQLAGAVSKTALVPTAVFQALRDGVITSNPTVEARRAVLEEVFAALAEAGVQRDNLLEAWDFRTASDANTRGTLLAMRSDALGRLGADGIGCTIEGVDEDYLGRAARRVRGTFTVPWYLTEGELPAHVARDDSDQPVWQENREVQFFALVPDALAEGTATGPLVTWGHGLFGSAEGWFDDGGIVDVSVETGSVGVATDWAGMSEKDLGFLAGALANVSDFWMVGEMLQQGMINQIALTRSLLGKCRLSAPFVNGAAASIIDPARRYFIGGSQGSVLGGTLATLSPDVERSALLVGGANFSFMIERSIHFNQFSLLLVPSYGDRVKMAILMALSQHVWDRAESAAWIGASQAGLEGIGPKRFVYLVALNDAQVPNLAADIAMRTAGVPVLEGSVRTSWGLETVTSPHLGSAYTTFDVGDRPVPEGNLSPEVDDGGHGSVGLTPEAVAMMSLFFETGAVSNPCQGPCDLKGD